LYNNNCTGFVGVPFVSKLYIDLECNILIAGIYKCPSTTNVYKSLGEFVNNHRYLYKSIPTFVYILPHL